VIGALEQTPIPHALAASLAAMSYGRMKFASALEVDGHDDGGVSPSMRMYVTMLP
jgi:hypothetical protein